MPVVDVPPRSVARDPQHTRPVAAVPAGDDTTAGRLLQRAQGAFQKWPEGFRGFTARLRCQTPDGEAAGQVRVLTARWAETVLARPEEAPGVFVEVCLSTPGVAARVERMIEGMVRDRVPRFFKDGDGRFPLTLERPAGEGPGCRIVVHRDDGAGLAYSLDGAGRLRASERRAGSKRIVTTFEEFVRATPGRFLPTRTTTACFDAATGRALWTATIVDVHRRIGHIWLPAGREHAVREGGDCRITTLAFDGHVVL